MPLLVEESGSEPAERKPQAKRQNLGYSMLLSVVEDYRRASGPDFDSAKHFLFPADKAGRDHLAWAIGLTGEMIEHDTRITLDRLRPQWDRERKRKR
jgi:hypothetical protein